jgi:hypothetical protein
MPQGSILLEKFLEGADRVERPAPGETDSSSAEAKIYRNPAQFTAI